MFTYHDANSPIKAPDAVGSPTKRPRKPRQACTFTQSDVARAVKGVQQGGVEVRRVEIDKEGKIVVVAGKPDAGLNGGGHEWDNI
jgi:hypothetical protein